MPAKLRIEAVIRELLDLNRRGEMPAGEFREPMLMMGAGGGRLVETVARAVKPKRGLEIGTSSGFSALCAVKGARDGGADFHLVTVDQDPAKAEWARRNFERAGVADRIETITADGLEAAGSLPGPWDYVLLDAAKALNLPILKTLLAKLNPGAVVLTDNAVTHESELREFTAFVRQHPELASSRMELGNGVEVTFKLV